MAEVTWDDAYKAYRNQLLSGDVNADFIRSTYEPLSKDFADRIIAIHKDLANQQKATLQGGKTLGDQWYGGDIGKEDATWDMAFRLAETGVGSLYDIGQRQVEREVSDEGATWTQIEPELFNKRTGDAITNFNNRGSKFDTIYNLQFTPNGIPIAYTSNKQSDWVEFREVAKLAANTIGMLTPAAPYIAAANAANFAKKGEWEKAALSAIAAAGPIATDFNAGADTLKTIKNVSDAARLYKAATEGDIFQAALSAASMTGSSVIPGTNISVADAAKTAAIMKAAEQGRWFDAAMGAGSLAGYQTIPGTSISLDELNKAASTTQQIKNAFETKNPFALVGALQRYGKPPKALTPDEVAALAGDEGYFTYLPSDTFNGVVDMNVPEQGEVDLSEFLVRPTPIEIPEIVSGRDEGVVEVVGKRLPYEMAQFPDLPGFELKPEDLDLSQYLVQPTPIEIPEIVSEPEFPEMVITAPRLPEEGPRFPYAPPIEMTPEDLAPPEIIPTPIDIPPIVGPTPAPAPKPPAAPAPKPPAAPAPAPFDLSGLLLLLGGQQQGPIPLTVPDNAADIKLMEEIFGTSLSAPSTGNETDKATALARLLRS